MAHSPASMDYCDTQGRRPDDAIPSNDPNSTATLRSNMQNAANSRRRNDESWVEIASQPSSSSLSSIGDEIITTGLRVHRNPTRRRYSLQPRQQSMPQSYLVSHSAARGNTSSQEDCGETESEEDASLLNLGSQQQTAVANSTLSRPRRPHESSGYDDDDDSSGDENATALGLRPAANTGFRPQPNAFSHPPSHLTHRHSTPAYVGGGSTPYSHQRVRSRRSSFSRGSNSRGAPHFMSPNYREDNDAALRASLTTLLSCAAAARGLPKRSDHGEPDNLTGPAANAAAMQPMGLRLVPEAELMGNVSPRSGAPPSEPKSSHGQAAAAGPMSALVKSPSSTSSRDAIVTRVAEKSKRAAGQKTSGGRATKKKRTEVDNATLSATFMSPTVLTWVVSAGVVVLVSVVGFGAGYVIGREVGRQEGAGGLVGPGGVMQGGAEAANSTAGSCGREIARSTTGGTLRRFRWGSMGKSVAA